MRIGTVAAIMRYPVKSMASESLQSCLLGWHGLEGDRRFAFRRLEDTGGFPWLTAGRLPSLIRYQPFRYGKGQEGSLPTHVRTPDGQEFELRSEELRAEIARLFGKEVQLMQLNQGIFDEAALSLISLGTIAGLELECGKKLDARRFRPNLVVETVTGQKFAEDDWVGKTIYFGTDDGPEVSIMLRDVRCAMINLDPDTALSDPVILKSVVRTNSNCAGVYATVTKPGFITVGQKLYLK